MKIALILFAVVAATVASNGDFASKRIVSPSNEEIFNDNEGLEELTFITQQDHTRPQERHLYQFTYFANLAHYVDGNTFYVYIKDAGELSNRRIQEGLMVDIAARTGAGLFTFNQRYFGENRISEDTSYENLRYLTIEQTLSDIAVFVTEIKRQHLTFGRRNRVVLWGSGYGATLAAWARKRYPHVIDAVWSSSGSFNIESFTFSQYDQLSYVLLGQGSEECHQQVEQAFEVVQQLVLEGQGEYIQERLNLCSPVNTTNTQDIGALFQSHVQAVLTYIDERHADGVRDFCTDMARINGDPLNSFARWKLHVFGHDLECFDYSYDTIIARNAEVAYDAPAVVNGRRQWYYYQCTQLGQFSVTDDTTWLPNALEPEFHLQKCGDIFGPEYSAVLQNLAVRDIQVEFGSLDQRITNILYTNGAIDPWLYNGMLATRDFNATTILIAGVAKSADLGSISTYDSPQLHAAKVQIEEQIVQWSGAAE